MNWTVGHKLRAECTSCLLYQKCHNPFIPPAVEDEAQTVDLAVVGEGPGYHEDLANQYFVGMTGQTLDGIVDESKWRDLNIAFFNAVQCYPGRTQEGDGKPSMEQVRACRPLLLANLKAAQPKAIIALGQWATRALSNDGRATIGGKYPTRLRKLDIPGWPDAPRVTSTYHPAAIFHQKNPALRQTIIQDLDYLFQLTFCEGHGSIPEFGVLTPGTLMHSSWGHVSLDFETGSRGEIYSLALHALGVGKGWAAVVDRIDADYAGHEWRTALHHFLRQPSLILSGHNFSSDLLALSRSGVVLPKFIHLDDTLSRARCLWENDPDRSLETLAQARLGLGDYGSAIREYKRQSPQDFGAIAPKDILLNYNYGDAYASALLIQATEGKIPPAILSLLNRKQYYLAWATIDGQQIDGKVLGQKQKKFDRVVRTARATLCQVTGIRDYDPRSEEGIDFPWKVLKWDPLKENKTGPSLNEDTLKFYLKFGKPRDQAYAKALLEFRKGANRADRLRNDFTLNRDEGGRVHAQFNTARAVTLRDSSSRPNYQNVTPELREIVVSRWPGGWLSHADMKGLEPRIMAHITRCKILLDILRDPKTAGKIYEILGSEIMGRTIQKYDAQGRKTIEYGYMKETILATNYNALAYTLQQNIFSKLGVEVELHVCQGWIDKYMRLAPELKDYMWAIRKAVLDNQEVHCSTGFIRHLPNNGVGNYQGSDLQKLDARAFKHAWNQGVNVDTQHLASLIAKLWALYVMYHLDKLGLLERSKAGRALHVVYLGPVHDSVSHDNRMKKIAQQTLQCYASALEEVQEHAIRSLIGEDLIVPLDIDSHTGKNWRFD